MACNPGPSEAEEESYAGEVISSAAATFSQLIEKVIGRDDGVHDTCHICSGQCHTLSPESFGWAFLSWSQCGMSFSFSRNLFHLFPRAD